MLCFADFPALVFTVILCSNLVMDSAATDKTFFSKWSERDIQKSKVTVITQPGMRYAQANAIVEIVQRLREFSI